MVHTRKTGEVSDNLKEPETLRKHKYTMKYQNTVISFRMKCMSILPWKQQDRSPFGLSLCLLRQILGPSAPVFHTCNPRTSF